MSDTFTETAPEPVIFSLGGESSNGSGSQPQGDFPDRPKKTYPVIPAGQIVPVEVVEVCVRDIPPAYVRNPDTTTEISYHFKVSDGQWGPDASGRGAVHLWGRTPPWFNNTERCRFRLWIEAILGVPKLPEGFQLAAAPEPNKQGETVNVFHIFDGMHCRVQVGNYTTKGDNPTLKHVVDDVLPLKPFTDAEDIF